MSRRRLLLLSLLFLIIITSLLIAAPVFLNPLRRDSIPAGTYVIPWMRPSIPLGVLYQMSITPNVTWDLNPEVIGALRIDVTFDVSLPNETRVIPSSIYLGHDADYLYVGGILRGVYGNPETNVSWTYGDFFNLLLDVDNDGRLTFPEAGSHMAVAITIQNRLSAGLYVDAAWDALLVRQVQGQFVQGAWNVAQNMCQQPIAWGNFIPEYFGNNGTLIFIYSKHLRLAGSCANALQMRPGERWVMGFTLELGFVNPQDGVGGSDNFQDFVSDWPRQFYPYLTNDTSWWPKLAIDLANPPATFTQH